MHGQSRSEGIPFACDGCGLAEAWGVDEVGVHAFCLNCESTHLEHQTGIADTALNAIEANVLWALDHANPQDILECVLECVEQAGDNRVPCLSELRRRALANYEARKAVA